jgi:hypothetical protein
VLSVSEFCDETLIVKVLKKIVCDSGNWKERKKKSEDINETCNASEEIDLLYMQLFFLFIIYFWVSFQ